MKSLMLFWKEVANELATWCGTSTTHDYNKLVSRVKHEGDEFLTITLPSYARDFERSLELGMVSPQLYTGFARKGGLPLFLGGFQERVFDRGTGRLLDEPCVDSIFAIRQLTLMFGKILRPCSDARNEEAMRKFVECDAEVKENDRNTSQESLRRFKRMSVLLFGQLLTDVERNLYESRFLPKHGPGSTAERLRGNAKYEQSEWTLRLEKLFPFSEFALPSLRFINRQDRVHFREPGEERPVRVVTVPKTLKTPRIIAIEPTCMQYMQQAILGVMVPRIEKDVCLSQYLGFSDQEPNRLLAREGSHSGNLATLDLSEASDRVSNQHVRLLLSNHPFLNEAVDATRSRKADVPGHGVIRLAKYASMGSALCFPFEAMVFLTCVFLGIEQSVSRQLTRKDVTSFAGQVRVYGDDIIVPVDHVHFVIRELEAFGFRVNTNKSFWTGKFRESCGGDFYDGHWVTPVRVRRDFPTGRADTSELMSAVSLRNQLYFTGLWRSAGWIDDMVSQILRHYPIVDSNSAALGRHSFLPPKGERMDTDLQVPLVRAYRPVPVIPKSPLDDAGALLKCLLSLEQRKSDEPVADSEHLTRSGRAESVNIKLGWIPLP